MNLLILNYLFYKKKFLIYALYSKHFTTLITVGRNYPPDKCGNDRLKKLWNFDSVVLLSFYDYVFICTFFKPNKYLFSNTSSFRP